MLAPNERTSPHRCTTMYYYYYYFPLHAIEENVVLGERAAVDNPKIDCCICVDKPTMRGTTSREALDEEEKCNKAKGKI